MEEEGASSHQEDSSSNCLLFIDHGTVESRRYHLARKTLLEMLWDRGYAVPVTDIDLSLSSFRSLHGPTPDPDKLTYSTHLISHPSKKVMVVFCRAVAKVKLAELKEIYSRFGKENLSGMILVLQSPLSPQAKERMKDLFRFKVETFQITELLVNITRHVLKPTHEVLTAAEKQKLLKKYNIEDNQLPRMLESDAIARYYGLEKGKVLKITYDGEITGSHVTYRCIV